MPARRKLLAEPVMVSLLAHICFNELKYIVIGCLTHRSSVNFIITSLIPNYQWYIHFMGNKLGPDSIKRCHLTSIGNPIVEIRRSYDRLISTMGFPIPVRRHLYIESGPWCLIWEITCQNEIPYPNCVMPLRLHQSSLITWSTEVGMSSREGRAFVDAL